MSSLISSFEGGSATSGTAFRDPFGIQETAVIILQKGKIDEILSIKFGINHATLDLSWTEREWERVTGYAIWKHGNRILITFLKLLRHLKRNQRELTFRNETWERGGGGRWRRNKVREGLLGFKNRRDLILCEDCIEKERGSGAKRRTRTKKGNRKTLKFLHIVLKTLNFENYIDNPKC